MVRVKGALRSQPWGQVFGITTLWVVLTGLFLAASLPAMDISLLLADSSTSQNVPSDILSSSNHDGPFLQGLVLPGLRFCTGKVYCLLAGCGCN